MTWRHRSAVLGCGCRMGATAKDEPGTPFFCEQHGQTWIVRVTEVAER